MISTLFQRGTMENYNMTGDDKPRSCEILAGIIFHRTVLCWVIVFTGVQTAGVYSQGGLWLYIDVLGLAFTLLHVEEKNE